MAKTTIPVPTESVEQTSLFRWAGYERHKYPELDLLYHIPNGGSRNKIEAKNLKMQGVRKGVPDICLPVARGKYHGLYIELKRIKGGTVSADQKEWIEKLNNAGYYACVCKGWEAAKDVIMEYLLQESNKTA